MERRLAAILAADVVGYSRLIGADEAGTLTMLRALRKELVEPTLKRHRGRVVKLMGDGLLAEFASVVDAVAAAVEIQEATPERSAHLADDRRIALRIGVNTGDIVVEDGDIFGDGVNIAARLQEIADPNGVMISDGAHRELRGKLDLPFEDVGEKDLKNIAEPVRSWLWSSTSTPADLSEPDGPPLASPDKPSIAVLPFVNMSGDPEQEYFSDGLTEDIITALAHWRSFPVISRNSTFTYKDKSVDIKQVGRELGARYLVEGSVRKSDKRVRITAQLINGNSGHHIWAERYDRQLDDIFELQDEITQRLTATIAPELVRAEVERSTPKRPEDPDAWDLCRRGMAMARLRATGPNEKAREFYQRAIAIKPDYSDAHAGISFTYHIDILLQNTSDREGTALLAMNAAREAVRFGTCQRL